MSTSKGIKRPFGNCPSRLNCCEAHMWRKLVRACVPGLLLPSDRVCFELLVKLATKLYWNGHFYPTLTAGERKVLVTLAAKFGMTPGDRKLIVDKQAQSQWVEEGKEKYGL